jgi:hypothetical protein
MAQGMWPSIQARALLGACCVVLLNCRESQEHLPPLSTVSFPGHYTCTAPDEPDSQVLDLYENGRFQQTMERRSGSEVIGRGLWTFKKELRVAWGCPSLNFVMPGHRGLPSLAKSARRA